MEIKLSYQDSSNKIEPLDGLRGIAVLSVVFFHCFKYIPFFKSGFLGVDLFFVLSGFLITGILLDVRNHPNYYKNFYGKRLIRIFPLYYGLLTIIMLFNAIKLSAPDTITHYLDMVKIANPDIYTWLYLQNWHYTFKGEFPQGEELSTLTHFWSLAVEEQFYLLWPLLIRKVHSKHLITVILALIALSFLTRVGFFMADNTGYYANTIARLDAICIGSLIAVLIRTHKDLLEKYFLPVGLICFSILAAFIMLDGASRYNAYIATVGFTIAPIFFGCLLLYAISSKGIARKIFTNQILVTAGKYSYGLYVYHYIIYKALTPVVRLQLQSIGLSIKEAILLNSILLVILSVIVSILSFELFEKRFLYYRHYFTNKPIKAQEVQMQLVK